MNLWVEWSGVEWNGGMDIYTKLTPTQAAKTMEKMLGNNANGLKIDDDLLKQVRQYYCYVMLCYAMLTKVILHLFFLVCLVGAVFSQGEVSQNCNPIYFLILPTQSSIFGRHSDKEWEENVNGVIKTTKKKNNSTFNNKRKKEIDYEGEQERMAGKTPKSKSGKKSKKSSKKP